MGDGFRKSVTDGARPLSTCGGVIAMAGERSSGTPRRRAGSEVRTPAVPATAPRTSDCIRDDVRRAASRRCVLSWAEDSRLEGALDDSLERTGRLFPKGNKPTRHEPHDARTETRPTR